MIPPQQNAEFVARMEDILELYQQPEDPLRPMVCMDEQPVALRRDVREPIPAAPGRKAREDFEYERTGNVAVFMFTAPLQGWRRSSARQRRTKLDWAHEIRQLLDVDFPNVEKVILVCDNLNTHRLSALYEAFPPEEARRLVRRIEIHYTPKHGSWLNIAEIELSALTKQCLGGRIPDVSTLKRQMLAWQVHRNAAQKGVNWRFTTADARIKLRRLYPLIQMS